MQQTNIVATFTSARRGILERMNKTRLELDVWPEDHINEELQINELAQLEGLLGMRRELLDRLSKLDGDLVGKQRYGGLRGANQNGLLELSPVDLHDKSRVETASPWIANGLW